MLLVVGLEAAQDLDGVFQGGLVDVDLLEAADQGAVLLEVVAELLVGRGADAAQRAGGERGLEQVGGVHRAPGGGAGADDGVDLVDEQDGAGVVLQFRDHGLEALLEVAAVAGAGEQGAHVEGEDGRLGQHLGDVALDDALGQALGDGGLADAGIAHVERVVLGPATQDLDGALDLRLAADEGIDLAGHGLLVEVHAVVRQGVLVAAAGLLLALLLVVRLVGVGAAGDGTLGGAAGGLGDAVADEVDGVEPGHVLELEEIDGVGFTLGEQGDEDVGAGDLVAAGGLDMDGGALDDALEAGGGLGIAGAVGGEACEVLVEEFAQVRAQLVEIDPAGAQHGGCVGVVGKAEQQMLEGGVFVTAIAGQGQGAVQRLFEVA